jgi:peroxiredoxin
VNDAFVMNAWAKDLAVENVKMIPDGAGHFTRAIGMLVQKPMQNFGMRSWRYSMIVDDGVITHWNQEPGKNDFSADDDPYEVSDPDTMLKQLGSKTFMQDIADTN